MGAIREIEQAAIEFIAEPTRYRFTLLARRLGDTISLCPVAARARLKYPLKDYHGYQKTCDLIHCPMATSEGFICTPTMWPSVNDGARAIAMLVSATMEFVVLLREYDDDP